MKKGRKNRERNITHAFFVFPSVCLYTLFSIFPIFLGIYYSFTDWDGIKKKYFFIGFKNYVKLFGDKRFWHSVSFNLRYTIFLVIGVTVLSIGIGLLLNQKVKGRLFFRAAYFFPAVISALTGGLIFNQIYGKGIPFIGEIFEIGILQKNILTSKVGAQFGILFVNLWQGVAIPTVLVLSALQTIPQELIESASLDGANGRQLFRYLIFPFLLPTISIIIILNLKSGLMLYDYVMALTTGGPARATESLTMLIYTQAFDEMKFGYAIAESIVVSTAIIIISIIQIYSTNRKKVYG